MDPYHIIRQQQQQQQQQQQEQQQQQQERQRTANLTGYPGYPESLQQQQQQQLPPPPAPPQIHYHSHPHHHHQAAVAQLHHHQHLQQQQQHTTTTTTIATSNAQRPELHQKCSRGSHSSDTSSAYSGSDTMASMYGSSMEADGEIDLSGLVESVVDSDEEDLAESMDSLNVRDATRDCLEKDPSERTDEDVETLLEFTQGFKAFTNITLAVRRALCSVMVFAVVDKAGTVVMTDGEELDSWSVLINGAVEIEHANGTREELQVGDSFGILPTMDKLYHRGVMRTKCDDCQFVCITQTDYYRIQHQGEENIRRHEDDQGRVVMVTELRQIGGGGGVGGANKEDSPTKRGHVVIRGTPERLLQQLVEENSMTDPTYVEDFLLTHRIFIKQPQEVTSKLLAWFEHDVEPHKTQELRDRVTRVVLLWVNNHFTDFEADHEMMEFLEIFEAGLERNKLLSQLRLLHIACAAKARMRSCTLTRSSREETLNFQIIGGYELRNVAASLTGSAGTAGIYIAHVEPGSKAQDIGLKRGDQIHEVNGQSFEHVTSKRAMDILTGSTHLSITVKSNLLGFKEMTLAVEQSANGSPKPAQRTPRRICVNDIAKLHGRGDTETLTRTHMLRLSSVDMLTGGSGDQTDFSSPVHVASGGNMATNFMQQLLQSVGNTSAKKLTAATTDQQHTPSSCESSSKGGGFMTLAPKRRLQKALARMNLLNKPQAASLNDSTDTLLNDTKPKLTATTTIASGRLFQSQSNPDLTTLSYDDDSSSSNNNNNTTQSNKIAKHLPRPAAAAPDYPEHVLKVYKSDQTCKYLAINKETTAHEVVMLTLREFGIHEPSPKFSLCEVSVGEGGMVKQRRLPDQLQNLAERISFAARYYLKLNDSTEPLVPDELALELVRESSVHVLQLNAYELAIQLTLQDFANFRQIESTEYIDELFALNSKYGVPMLSKFAELVNREMFWVVSEICTEPNSVRRMKIVKQFIKIARHCKECRNFNSLFAIVSGLGHGAVSRLRLTWERLPSKYQRLFKDLQDLMDPSRNMSKYRQLVAAELLAQHPIIPFYPIVRKDLTFIHLGNDTRVDGGLINFEKLRMLAKEVRLLTHMCSSPYDLLAILELKGHQTPSTALFSLNQMSASQTNASSAATVIAANAGQTTIKRRKKSTAVTNQKKMFEEAQMVRRVKAYLNNMKIITDEELLHKYSLDCEPPPSAQHHNNSSTSSAHHHGHSHGHGGGGNLSLRSTGTGDQLSIYSQTSTSSAPNSSISGRKRHPSSPTLSTTSSASSTSADQQHQNRRHLNPKFGTASPQAVRKLLSLAESTKVRTGGGTHQHAPPRHGSLALTANLPHHLHGHPYSAPIGGAAGGGGGVNASTLSTSPHSHRRLASSGNIGIGRALHERSHSDTPTPPPPPLPSVDLSLESSSVTTFRDLPLRKSVTSGSISSCDSGHGSYAQLQQQQQQPNTQSQSLHAHFAAQMQQKSMKPNTTPPTPPVYTPADCRLLQQISSTTVLPARNLCSSPCGNPMPMPRPTNISPTPQTHSPTSTPTPTPTPPPPPPHNKPSTANAAAPAYMQHMRHTNSPVGSGSGVGVLYAQPTQSQQSMPPPPPPSYMPHHIVHHHNHHHHPYYQKQQQQQQQQQQSQQFKQNPSHQQSQQQQFRQHLIAAPPNFADNNPKCSSMPPMNQ